MTLLLGTMHGCPSCRCERQMPAWMLDEPTPRAVLDSLPEGWEITANTGYQGSNLCRRIEAHRIHEGPHRDCTVTVYGPYKSDYDYLGYPGVGARLLEVIEDRSRVGV